jgi:hypothetical protein
VNSLCLHQIRVQRLQICYYKLFISSRCWWRTPQSLTELSEALYSFPISRNIQPAESLGLARILLSCCRRGGGKSRLHAHARTTRAFVRVRNACVQGHLAHVWHALRRHPVVSVLKYPRAQGTAPRATATPLPAERDSEAPDSRQRTVRRAGSVR